MACLVAVYTWRQTARTNGAWGAGVSLAAAASGTSAAGPGAPAQAAARGENSRERAAAHRSAGVGLVRGDAGHEDEVPRVACHHAGAEGAHQRNHRRHCGWRGGGGHRWARRQGLGSAGQRGWPGCRRQVPGRRGTHSSRHTVAVRGGWRAAGAQAARVSLLPFVSIMVFASSMDSSCTGSVPSASPALGSSTCTSCGQQGKRRRGEGSEGSGGQGGRSGCLKPAQARPSPACRLTLNCSGSSSGIRATASRSCTSSTRVCTAASGKAALMASAIACRRASRRAISTSLQPASAKRQAHASPMPALAPGRSQGSEGRWRWREQAAGQTAVAAAAAAA